ncbi:uncharacterized protein BXZ73DRAFT_81083 [Epithele typhae]|uniref:uncharacterized protein n=1 Tax=Epithele typhae TaxID=378194 RepID=UPI002008515D|nr:uncharacterized protein BXZ73DRAFT_81083 [Epithele typhae]KAH9916399.1 hypothetical protein BXZ73DRAFT_81083 [Epithele typhae]
MDVESEDLVEAQKELVAILYYFGIPSIPYIYAACIGLLLWGYVNWGEGNQGCGLSGALQFIAAFAVGLVDLVFMVLRIHVINARNRFWTTVIIVLGLTTVPLNIILVIRNEDLPMPEPFMGCGNKTRVSNLGDDALWTKRWSSTAMIFLSFVKPVIATLITWYHTYEAVRASRGSHMQPTFAYLLLRDGATCPFNHLHKPPSSATIIVTGILVYLEVVFEAIVTPISFATSSIFFSRCILHLRLAEAPSPSLTTISARHAESIQFAARPSRFDSLLDNIGAPLSVGEEDADLPDEDADKHGRGWASEHTADGDLDATSGAYQKVRRSDSFDDDDDGRPRVVATRSRSVQMDVEEAGGLLRERRSPTC